MKKILFMGNPNVGKSVIFSKVTGIEATASNYPGTTVELKKGKLKYKDISAEIIDVPGTYSLESVCEAEEVAIKVVDEADVIINVVDATHLERNLGLTISLIEKDIPIIVALNMFDEAKHKGISIDVEKLEKLLGVPVIPTVAVTGEGLKEIISNIKDVKKPLKIEDEDENKYAKIGKIINEIQTIHPKKHTRMEWLEDITIKPITGIPIAIVVVILSFATVIGLGMGVRQHILLPIFRDIVSPAVREVVRYILVDDSILRRALIESYCTDLGKYVGFGVLTDGIEWPLALVLPYLLAFYFVLAILEDTGYIPRLACILDSVFHKIGVHGSAIIPFLLGFGCTVGGIISTRTLEAKRDRLIVATLMCLAIPCAAQSGAIVALLAERSIPAFIFVFLFGFAFIIVAGIVMNKLLPGTAQSFLMEIPSFRMPTHGNILKKMWIQLKTFLVSTVPIIVFGVFIASILYETGALETIGYWFEPIVVGVLGLPMEASVALILGIVRRELAIAVLLELELTIPQLIVGAVVSLLYIPCAAVFPILIREFDIKYAIIIALSTIFFAFLMGGMLNFIFMLIF